MLAVQVVSFIIKPINDEICFNKSVRNRLYKEELILDSDEGLPCCSATNQKPLFKIR